MQVAHIHQFPSLASYRYRAEMPARLTGAKLNDFNCDVLVFSKPQASDVDAARRAHNQGQTVIVDFCDDHFNKAHYRQLAQLADYCVCPTEEMRRRIPAANVAVIPDPYEMEELEPHAFGEQLLWFGHNAGIAALTPHKNLKNLTIVTGPKIEEGMVEYSPENLKREMARANIAIFPTLKGHEYKSPNRVINALRMGLFPVCARHPSYTEFKKFLWQSDIRTGLTWASEFRHELNDLVKQGQDYIRDRYSPEAIGEKWKDLFESI